MIIRGNAEHLSAYKAICPEKTFMIVWKMAAYGFEDLPDRK